MGELLDHLRRLEAEGDDKKLIETVRAQVEHPSLPPRGVLGVDEPFPPKPADPVPDVKGKDV